MEILSHFRTIEELTKTLSREQGLLSEMFEKRKLMKFPQGLNQYHQMVENEHLVPDTFLSDDKLIVGHKDCQQLISQLRGIVNQKRETIEKLKDTVINFNRNFKPKNAFHFNTMPVTDNDYLQIELS